MCTSSRSPLITASYCLTENERTVNIIASSSASRPPSIPFSPSAPLFPALFLFLTGSLRPCLHLHISFLPSPSPSSLHAPRHLIQDHKPANSQPSQPTLHPHLQRPSKHTCPGAVPTPTSSPFLPLPTHDYCFRPLTFTATAPPSPAYPVNPSMFPFSSSTKASPAPPLIVPVPPPPPHLSCPPLHLSPRRTCLARVPWSYGTARPPAFLPWGTPSHAEPQDSSSQVCRVCGLAWKVPRGAPGAPVTPTWSNALTRESHRSRELWCPKPSAATDSAAAQGLESYRCGGSLLQAASRVA